MRTGARRRQRNSAGLASGTACPAEGRLVKAAAPAVPRLAVPLASGAVELVQRIRSLPGKPAEHVLQISAQFEPQPMTR